MSLSKHVNPEDIIHHLQDLRVQPPSSSNGSGGRDKAGKGADGHLTVYSSRYTSQADIPKYNLPDDGCPSDTVYAMIKDELDLDGRPNLNLASFVNTYADDNATKLMVDNLAKNLADNDEYPAMLSMSDRCVSILANLWGVQPNEKAIGAPTVGSSEAIHLGGLAMKRRWQEKRRKEGKDTLKPNIIMGANAQVALEKFARYFEVEARILPVSKESKYRLDVNKVKENVDENTIGVFVILGSTYTGHYEPVEEVSNILDEIEKERGWDVPIHVDAASGGFVAPFTHAKAGKGLRWNFELPRVKSINASGHKYGLVTAGVGWIVFRDESMLPKDLIFELHYLGGTEQSYTLNFSRPGAQTIVQYYNLIHLGFNGYREIMENCLANARVLSRSLEATGWYTCVSDIHRPVSDQPEGGNGAAEKIKETASAAAQKVTGNNEEDTSANYVAGLPVVSFRFTDEFKKQYPHIKQEWVSVLARARGWIIPNYALPPNEQQTEILRVVVRESMSFDLLERLVTDIVQVTQTMMDHDEIDLTIMHKQKQRRRLVDEKGKQQNKQPGVGKRMEEGIHRSVC
ncbi:glutamate decarboxylase [Cladorrhinum sp. PSN259]|nr:glutamate decarboxylase [Cladorrhinum sp. PSN259]